jgi:hypothetical protein
MQFVQYIDTEEYPSTEKIKEMCVSMLADLWHAGARHTQRRQQRMAIMMHAGENCSRTRKAGSRASMQSSSTTYKLLVILVPVIPPQAFAAQLASNAALSIHYSSAQLLLLLLLLRVAPAHARPRAFNDRWRRHVGSSEAMLLLAMKRR